MRVPQLLKAMNTTGTHSGLCEWRMVPLQLRATSCISAAHYTVRSESRCALRLRYVDLVVSIEVAVEVCCSFTVFSC
jgi:hypothetical protein